MILHIECEGTLPGMNAVGVHGDFVSRSAVGRTLDNAHQHLVGDFQLVNAAVVVLSAVLPHGIDARLAASDTLDTRHHLVGDQFLHAGLDEEVQELRSLWRGEFRRHGGEEVVPQELADVASEMLLQIEHLKRGERGGCVIMLDPQQERIM